MDSQPEKVPCAVCNALILPTTAKKNDGVCMKCLPRFRARTLTLDTEAQAAFDEFWSALHKCGWLSELSSESAENLRLDLVTSFETGEEDPLRILATGYIVDESIESEGDYVALLQVLAQASGGVFAPEDVRDSFDEEAGTATLSFCWRGGTYETTVPFENDDFHPDVLQFINDVLVENGVRKQFLPLFFEEEPGVNVVFVSQETYDAAIELGLIPDFSAA